MPTVDDFKSKIGEQYFIIDKDGNQVKYKNNDGIPFTLIKITGNTMFLMKERGSWQHREDFDNDRFLTQSLVTTLK